jgi:hypothetical protein
MAEGNIVLVALYDVESMAVRMLHAVLKREEIPVKSIFFKEFNQHGMELWTREEVDTLIAQLKELKPLMVGLSVRSAFLHLAAEITDRVRKELGCLVVLGGSHVSANPRQSMEYADAACVGEGEETLVELVRRLQAGQSIEGIANLWIKKDGQIIEQAPRPLIADLDSLPFTDYLNDDKILINHGKVLPLPGVETQLAHLMITGRGCPYNCTYCCNNTFRTLYQGKGKYVRRRSVENVMAELHWAREHFPNMVHVSFWDDVFSMDLDWMRRFHARYKQEIGLPFFCYCHPKTTSDSMISLLKDAGVVEMVLPEPSIVEHRVVAGPPHEVHDGADPLSVLLRRLEHPGRFRGQGVLPRRVLVEVTLPHVERLTDALRDPCQDVVEHQARGDHRPDLVHDVVAVLVDRARRLGAFPAVLRPCRPPRCHLNDSTLFLPSRLAR